jgi:predicted DNA-binding protein
MPLSIRLDPALEARVEAESRRRGVTKSDVIKDALERVLSLKTPRTLLD